MRVRSSSRPSANSVITALSAGQAKVSTSADNSTVATPSSTTWWPVNATKKIAAGPIITATLPNRISVLSGTRYSR